MIPPGRMAPGGLVFMGMVSTVFLIISVWLAFLFGSQVEPWTWGPAFVSLGCSVLFSLFSKHERRGNRVLLISLLLAAAWITVRCFQSPVLDYGRGDFMAVAGLLGVIWVVVGIAPDGREMRLLYVGLAVSVLANVVLAMAQWRVPDLMWPYAQRPLPLPTGFFSHYNYFSNFVIGGGLLLLGRALLGSDGALHRSLYGLAYLGTLVAVPLSGSRGGMLALGFGTVLCLIALGIVGWRTKSRWRAWAFLALPAVVLLGIAGSWFAIKHIQMERKQGDEFRAVADNASRLEWMDVALQVSTDHPAVGGGSQSFSWELNDHWDVEDSDYNEFNIRFVHNEFLQLVVDYGWIGAALVFAALAVAAGLTMSGLIVGKRSKSADVWADPIHVGIVAAAGAVLLQANFSFVFHMLPSVVLLGIFFGLTASACGPEGPVGSIERWLRFGFGGAMLMVLLFFGGKATFVLYKVWPVVYGEKSLAMLAPKAALDQLKEAEQQWPGYRLAKESGDWARVLAKNPELDPEERRSWNERAAEDYRRGMRFHPFDPGLAVNLGNACSDLGRNEEAESHLKTAIRLQGGLEAGYKGRYFLARHLYTVWQERWLKERRAEEALGQFLRAHELLEEAEPLHWAGRAEVRALKASLTESIKFLEGAGVRPAESEE